MKNKRATIARPFPVFTENNQTNEKQRKNIQNLLFNFANKLFPPVLC
ncbi:hypothetical protein G5574_00950 [Pantoea stewartii]|nr:MULTISPECIES: hypothetical protein [Pantoea]MDF7784854.1 hypothetical protein [Pantoea stewartii]QIE95621.1 hypothetical protein G5574_00950 [Pantoea stewartii]UYK98714.1 hypothetical protein NG832_06830 [Pantoea stewartii]